MIRDVAPEILDSLAEGDPDALRNRRDIRLFNILMGNFRWFAREVEKWTNPNDRILEIGAGVGELGTYLQRSGQCAGDRRPLTGLDLWSRPAIWPVDWAWIQEDLMEFDGVCDYDVLLAGMVLHQFKDPELARFGSRLGPSVRVILASETSRRAIHLAQLKLAPLIGVNHVTRHDARVSVKAGFRGDELPIALGLDPLNWAWVCCSGWLGQYRMVAVRRAGDAPSEGLSKSV